MNSVRLKGIHLAMRTGMLAAETAFEAVRKGDTSEAALKALRGPHRRRAPCARSSIPSATSTRRSATGRSPARCSPGCRSSRAAGGSAIRCRRTAAGRGCKKLAEYYKDARPDPESTVNPVKIDRQLTFDRLTNVHYSGTRHPEDQPSHLIVHDADVCATRCREEYGNPCIRFCPANVYEMVDDGDGRQEAADQRVQLRALQDVRHHGPVPDHRLGPARRRRRARSTKACDRSRDGNAIARRAAIAARRRRRSFAALGATYRWRVEGLEHYESIVASGKQPIFAFWHGRILPATLFWKNRGIVVITSQNFDGEWIARHHPAVRLRHGARIDVARRRARAGAAAARPGGREARGVHDRRPARARRGSRSPAPSCSPARPAIRSCRFTSRRVALWTVKSWDRTQVPKPFSDVARGDRRADRRARYDRGHDRSDAPRARSGTARARSSRRSSILSRRQEVRSSSFKTTPELLTSCKETRDAADLIATLPGTHHAARPSRAARARGGVRPGRRRVARQGRHGRRAAAGDARGAAARPRRGARRRDGGDQRPRGDARCRHVHVARVVRDRAAGRRRGRAGGRARARHAARRRSRWCARRGITPSATRRWGSACSTTSRSRRPRRCARGLSRVAVVDIDVHHGNGTQWMFYADPRVLYVSTHQFPFYPGTGAADETGTGAGKGFTLNIPLAAGATDADYAAAYRDGCRPRSSSSRRSCC